MKTAKMLHFRIAKFKENRYRKNQNTEMKSYFHRSEIQNEFIALSPANRIHMTRLSPPHINHTINIQVLTPLKRMMWWYDDNDRVNRLRYICVCLSHICKTAMYLYTTKTIAYPTAVPRHVPVPITIFHKLVFMTSSHPNLHGVYLN